MNFNVFWANEAKFSQQPWTFSFSALIFDLDDSTDSFLDENTLSGEIDILFSIDGCRDVKTIVGDRVPSLFDFLFEQI